MSEAAAGGERGARGSKEAAKVKNMIKYQLPAWVSHVALRSK